MLNRTNTSNIAMAGNQAESQPSATLVISSLQLRDDYYTTSDVTVGDKLPRLTNPRKVQEKFSDSC